MRTYHDPSPSDDFPESVSKLLRQSTLGRPADGVDPERFVKDVRARIEQELASGDVRSEGFQDYGVPVGRRNTRRRTLGWLMAMGVTVATVFLLASFDIQIFNPPIHVEHVARGTADELAGVERYEIENGDAGIEARIGVQWVNLGLGQTIQSVDSARHALGRLIRPLKASNLASGAESKVQKEVVKPLDIGDEQFVSTLTQRVLGYSN